MTSIFAPRFARKFLEWVLRTVRYISVHWSALSPKLQLRFLLYLYLLWHKIKEIILWWTTAANFRVCFRFCGLGLSTLCIRPGGATFTICVPCRHSTIPEPILNQCDSFRSEPILNKSWTNLTIRFDQDKRTGQRAFIPMPMHKAHPEVGDCGPPYHLDSCKFSVTKWWCHCTVYGGNLYTFI